MRACAPIFFHFSTLSTIRKRLSARSKKIFFWQFVTLCFDTSTTAEQLYEQMAIAYLWEYDLVLSKYFELVLMRSVEFAASTQISLLRN